MLLRIMFIANSVKARSSHTVSLWEFRANGAYSMQGVVWGSLSAACS